MTNLFYEDFQDTSQAVNSRISAAIIDYIFFVIVIIAFLFIFGHKVSPNTVSVKGPLASFPLIFWFLYFVVFEFLFQGTMGKLILKLRVKSLNEGRVSFIQVTKRRVSDLIDFMWCFGILGILLIRKTKNNQRFGDMWAKTIVIKLQSHGDILSST